MTAEELAIELELQSSQMEYGYAVSDWKLLSDAATMLRQQQVEIEALKLRELTDEEIESAYWSLVGKQHEGKIASYLYNFARDILNKASEK